MCISWKLKCSTFLPGTFAFLAEELVDLHITTVTIFSILTKLPFAVPYVSLHKRAVTYLSQLESGAAETQRSLERWTVSTPSGQAPRASSQVLRSGQFGV